jgi:hypothetical protein
MKRPWRFARIVAGVVALWLVALVILGVALEGRTRHGVLDRLAESTQATATIDSGDLALVRGKLELDGLAIRRDDLAGKLSIDVANIRCDLPALGRALIDGRCRELAIHKARLDVSSGGLFKLKKPKRPPVRAERIVIDDAVLAFAPSAFVPELGAITITIEHAEAANTVFKTPLSWILALRSLRASLSLPAGLSIQLAYQDGVLTASSAMLGGQPIRLPVAIPVAELADDPQAELGRLIELARDVAKRLLLQRAQDWVDAQLAH